MIHQFTLFVNFFTKEEFDSLLKVIDNQDWKDLVEFAVNTGLRQMEILNLHKRQLNKQDRLIIPDNHYHTTKSRKIRICHLIREHLKLF